MQDFVQEFVKASDAKASDEVIFSIFQTVQDKGGDLADQAYALAATFNVIDEAALEFVQKTDTPDEVVRRLKQFREPARAAIPLIAEAAKNFRAVHNNSEITKVRTYMADHRNSISHRSASVTQHVESEINPPKQAEMLLHFALPKCDRECMIGDLEEEYRTIILPKYGARVAARWYWWQAVRSVVAASGARVRVWLSFGGLARAAGWIVEKFTL